MHLQSTFTLADTWDVPVLYLFMSAIIASIFQANQVHVFILCEILIKSLFFYTNNIGQCFPNCGPRPPVGRSGIVGGGVARLN